MIDPNIVSARTSQRAQRIRSVDNPFQDKSQRDTRSDDSIFTGLATRIGPVDDNHRSLGRNYIEPLARDFATSAHHTGLVGTALLVGSLYAAGDSACRRGPDGAPARVMLQRRVALLLHHVGLGDCLTDILERRPNRMRRNLRIACSGSSCA